MSEYEQIMEDWRASDNVFRARITRLRETCLHAEITGWLDGRYEGDARICKNCKKTVERRENGWTTPRWIKFEAYPV